MTSTIDTIKPPAIDVSKTSTNNDNKTSAIDAKSREREEMQGWEKPIQKRLTLREPAHLMVSASPTHAGLSVGGLNPSLAAGGMMGRKTPPQNTGGTSAEELSEAARRKNHQTCTSKGTTHKSYKDAVSGTKMAIAAVIYRRTHKAAPAREVDELWPGMDRSNKEAHHISKM
ncbi:hypothetical protein D910_08897 [Dendroctonus ponderosae]|uniref:Uncharacterized protein n=1 Tax=Dendroctonus ponderosae TaxID=77166 RepID=U4UEU9_DENPD|nr:hypothetical protein D910_08897 [Dendroctonus ponderosae]